MASNKKSFNYKQGGYTEGYVPGGERVIKTVEPDLVPVPVPVPVPTPGGSTKGGLTQVQKITPLNTTADGDLASNDSFLGQPLAGSHVMVDVNGLLVVPANGPAEQLTAACYFTDPTGSIVRVQGEFQIGDKLHWNGTMAGIELQTTDNINVIYQI